MNQLKQAAKNALRPIAQAAWPAVESVSRLSAPIGKGLSVHWSDAWTPAFDAALDQLPALQGCTRDQYRELVKPTDTVKRHALVSENGAPSALVSLRRRLRFWEPVTYQCLPGAIAPARDLPALGRALTALGVEVRVEAGLEADAQELACGHVEPYEVFQVALKTDYQAHWHKKNQRHLSTVRRSRRKCEDLVTRYDGEGDLSWIVKTWRQSWQSDPGGETVAAQDRLNFWSAIAKANSSDDESWALHTIQMLSGERRAAGVVLLCRRGVATFQCWSRDSDFDQLGVGNRALELAIAWAAENDLTTFDLGGGGVKHRWGPAATVRYGLTLCPLPIRGLYRLAPPAATGGDAKD